MANMNLPGVRRIEALITVLKTKEKEAIIAANLALPSWEGIRAIVDAEFGITDLRVRSAAAIEEANDFLRQINAITGERRQMKVESRYSSYDDKTEYERRVNELYEDARGTVVEDIKRSFAEKESALWLVESIEEAKAIVYGAQTKTEVSA